jgi:hypothetical protein
MTYKIKKWLSLFKKVFQVHNTIFYLEISPSLEISTFVNNCSIGFTYNPIVHAFIWVHVFIFILQLIVILNGHIYYNIAMGV